MSKFREYPIGAEEHASVHQGALEVNVTRKMTCKTCNVLSIRFLNYGNYLWLMSRYIDKLCDSDGGLENAKSVGARSEKALFGRLPVDHIPDILHICGFTILVLEIVGVFPLYRC